MHDIYTPPVPDEEEEEENDHDHDHDHDEEGEWEDEPDKKEWLDKDEEEFMKKYKDVIKESHGTK